MIEVTRYSSQGKAPIKHMLHPLLVECLRIEPTQEPGKQLWTPMIMAILALHNGIPSTVTQRYDSHTIGVDSTVKYPALIALGVHKRAASALVGLEVEPGLRQYHNFTLLGSMPFPHPMFSLQVDEAGNKVFMIDGGSVHTIHNARRSMDIVHDHAARMLGLHRPS